MLAGLSVHLFKQRFARTLRSMSLITKTPGNWFRSRNATLTGEISIGELASFWFNTVVRGDVAKITIGRRVNVQDNAVVHCDTGVPNVVEDDVTIGHGAIVHGDVHLIRGQGEALDHEGFTGLDEPSDLGRVCRPQPGE